MKLVAAFVLGFCLFAWGVKAGGWMWRRRLKRRHDPYQPCWRCDGTGVEDAP